MVQRKNSFKKILVVAPHPDDDAIGCGALLLQLTKSQPSTTITIAYAVSGFNGVTDRFARKVDPNFDAQPETEKRAFKSAIRKQEAIACCKYLNAKPVFWNAPFYEKQKKDFTDADMAIVEESIDQIKPDTVFLIDETDDPHQTHAIVHQLVLQALKNISFDGLVFGYRVWGSNYPDCQCDLKLFFDKVVMAEKIKLISFYESQILDPAFPHEHHSFIDLVKLSNKQVAQQCQDQAEQPYGECYKII